MFRIKTQIMETRPFDVARDSWRAMQRKAMSAVGEHWFREMLPNHFTPQARHKYDHKPRNNAYLETKKRWAANGKAIMGGLVDNVLTGAMKRALESSAVIRGFPTRCTVYLSGPPHLRIRFKSAAARSALGLKGMGAGDQPNKPAEILNTTAQEAELLKKVLRKVMRDQLNTYRAGKKTTNI
jgi:hypothetical protein